MNLAKILTVIGARPQFVKAAVVSRAIAVHNGKCADRESIDEVIVHSGQHYDINMSDIFFAEMDIPRPNHRLHLTKTTHGAMTGEMLEGVETIIYAEKPDAVLVYGDTNTTLAGALAAAKLHVPVAHVEAGLRSFNMRMPEEINRAVTDRVASWLFCPTAVAVDNLIREGFGAETGAGRQWTFLANVGDVMYDAALFYQAKAIPSEPIARLAGAGGRDYYLATVHRAENTDELARLNSIIKALDAIAAQKPVLLPLHPRTRKILHANGIPTGRITILEPVSYFDMLYLLTNCRGVFTDSGGLQKEAYFFGKPCATLRDETEWVELVQNGFAVLTGASYEKIIAAENSFTGAGGKQPGSLYGDGHAGDKIVATLAKAL
jgi:UDP-GlcNAc3NAcA epimerase